MSDLSSVLGKIEAGLNESIDSLLAFQLIQEQAHYQLQPLMSGAPPEQNMFFLSSTFDSMKCLLEIEIEENRRLYVSQQKATELVKQDVFGPALAIRLQDLSDIDAAINDGEYSRYVPGVLQGKAIVGSANHGGLGEGGDWKSWCVKLGDLSTVFTRLAKQIPPTHPLAPTLGLMINMLNSTHLWCEEQRRLQIAIEVLSRPNEQNGPDYGSFLRLELLELRRQAVPLPKREEEE